ncbi:glycoside hydrolase family 35 protein [Parafilimonas sp.]|uniref:glycoside hydrolase family 35 protein n=1 Tax=Parafilimonas sp. TaxID=1969739 RepID=UPI0039E6E5E8
MQKKNLFKAVYLIIVTLISFSASAQQKHIFSLGKEAFLLDGKPYQIISGEMHPARIPHAYWRQRIQMAKAMGCNTIAAYIFWNYHETSPGVFDFKTGNHNIAEFIKICQEEGMWVLLRPGPYVCAEWDFGGLPTSLLKIPDIKVRCLDPRYMNAVTKYVQQLAKEVAPLQCSGGGPILMVQVENEYGSYGNDEAYLETLRKLWLDNGINVPFYTADGPTPYMLEAGNVSGAAIGLDSGGSDADFDEAKKHNPDVPAFSSETYPGWLTHWGEKWAKVDTASIVKEVKWLLDNKKSFNLYVIHGGTNFGFTAGANAFSPTAYQPDITSYDYDAPINEQGRATPKYYALRNLISQYVSYKIPPVPAAIPTIEIPAIKMEKFASIWNMLPSPIQSPQPKPFEDFDQNQGCMLYRTTLTGHKSGTLTITEPHDYALIFLDGKFIDTIFREGGKWSVKLPKTDSKNPVLDILMEGMGHINFAQYMIDRKGITDRVTLNGMTLMNWQIYPLPLDDKFIVSVKQTSLDGPAKGLFFKGKFNLSAAGDTYFDMSQYTKGNVYVNGHNLGRYWSVGPQHSLYCPASWLKKGENEIVVFDLLQEEAADVSGVKTLN